MISIQTLLNFLSDTDMDKAIKSLYNNSEKGVIYATLCADTHYYKKYAKYVKNGLWNVKFDNGRVKYDLMYNFTKIKSCKKDLNYLNLFILIVMIYNLEMKDLKKDLLCGIKE